MSESDSTFNFFVSSAIVAGGASPKAAGTPVCTYGTYARTLNRTISQQNRRCEMLETTALDVRISPTA